MQGHSHQHDRSEHCAPVKNKRKNTRHPEVGDRELLSTGGDGYIYPEHSNCGLDVNINRCHAVWFSAFGQTGSKWAGGMEFQEKGDIRHLGVRKVPGPPLSH
jgi:hypothetical protein